MDLNVQHFSTHLRKTGNDYYNKWFYVVLYWYEQYILLELKRIMNYKNLIKNC